MTDLVERQAVLDTIHRFFTEEVDKIPTKKTEDGEVLIMCKAQPLFEMNKAICKRIKALPSASPTQNCVGNALERQLSSVNPQEPKILETIDFAIDASNGDTNYFVGLRNGLRYAKSLIDGEEPQFESCAEQEPKTGHCKDCKYFEYDSVAKVDGIPLIVAHEICSKWGDGCKTKEDGYCFLFEPQEGSEKE